MLKCNDCDLHYEVIWNYDGQEPPQYFCPRCGSESLEAETDVSAPVMPIKKNR